jgi:hypothetical protein
MALAERLQRLDTDRERGCSFGRFLLSLPDDERDLLRRVLTGPASNQTLRSELAAEGHRFSRDTIGDHRHGRCLCNAKEAGR